MSVEGLDSFNKTLKDLPVKIDNGINKALVKVGTKLLRNVKLKTPVDTGYLRRSWQISNGHGFVEVFTNVRYAKAVEFGHRTRNKTSFVEGKYMLTNAIKEIEKDLEKEFEMILEKAWE